MFRANVGRLESVVVVGPSKGLRVSYEPYANIGRIPRRAFDWLTPLCCCACFDVSVGVSVSCESALPNTRKRNPHKGTYVTDGNTCFASSS